MKIKYNTRIPLLPSFRAITLFGNLYIKGSRKVSDQLLNHERIHSRQWKELLHVGFIVWYLVEWFVRFVFYSIKWTVEPKSNFDWKHAYRNISFEREAYTNQSDESYIARRKRFSYLKYIK